MTIHIVYAADANYAAYAGISIVSVIASNPGAQLHFYFLADNVAPRDLARMQDIAARAPDRVTISVHDVARILSANPLFSGSSSRAAKHLTRTAYARLFLEELLPDDIEYVLYMDCDTICKSDLGGLWQRRFRTSMVMARPSDYFEGDRKDYKSEIGMPPEGIYYSSGIMLINLKAWRARGMSKQFVEFLEHFPNPRFFDQDAINAVLWREVQPLEPCWNSPFPEEARIIHYAGKFKPWELRFDGPGKDYFDAAKQASPWRWRMPEAGVRRYVKRLCSSLRRKMGTR